jgi:adenosylhomocysteine nucleosidase
MIGIISAMPEELAAVVEAMHAEQVLEYGGRRYHRGHYGREPVVCVNSRIGKVAAATTATILLERFAPRALVMTGLAGGIDDRLAIGDIVVADRLIQHDLDARPLFPRYEIPLLGVTEMHADPALSERLAAAAARFVPPPEVTALGIATPRVWRGLVASGDQFVGSAEASDALRAALPGLLAVEMEGAAVAQVCCEHGVPFAIGRIISDTANHAAAIDFSRFLATACGPYARHLVEGVLSAAK